MIVILLFSCIFDMIVGRCEYCIYLHRHLALKLEQIFLQFSLYYLIFVILNHVLSSPSSNIYVIIVGNWEVEENIRKN